MDMFQPPKSYEDLVHMLYNTIQGSWLDMSLRSLRIARHIVEKMIQGTTPDMPMSYDDHNMWDIMWDTFGNWEPDDKSALREALGQMILLREAHGTVFGSSSMAQVRHYL